MSPISESQISELVRHIDPKFISFFENTKTAYPYGFDNFDMYVSNLISEYKLESMRDAKVLYESEMTGRRKKRMNWVSKTKKNRNEFPYKDKKSFFYHIYTDMATKSNEFLREYETVDITRIIDIIISRIEQWRASSGRLIEFPNFPYAGKINIPLAFKSDLFIEVYKIIETKYDGNIQNTSFRRPIDMIMHQVFSAQRGKVEVTRDEDGKFISKVFGSDDYLVQLVDIPPETADEYDHKFPVLDDIDQAIISFLINNSQVSDPSLGSAVQTGGLIPVEQTTIGAICKSVLHTENPNKEQRENIRRRIIRLQAPIESSNESSGEFFSFSILSTVKVYAEDEHHVRLVEYTLGPWLSNVILTNRVLSLPSSKMHELTMSASRTLLVQLQMERISRTIRGESLTMQYSYSRLARIMLLRGRTVNRNMEVIQKALDDIQKNSGMIKEYRIQGPDITLTFLPLTDTEKKEIVENKELLIAQTQDNESLNQAD